MLILWRVFFEASWNPKFFGPSHGGLGIGDPSSGGLDVNQLHLVLKFSQGGSVHPF